MCPPLLARLAGNAAGPPPIGLRSVISVCRIVILGYDGSCSFYQFLLFYGQIIINRAKLTMNQQPTIKIKADFSGGLDLVFDGKP